MNFDALVSDLDGVVYRGDQVIAGVPEAIEELRARGVKIVFCTNNSRRTVGQYVDKLNGFGVPTGPDDIVTSAVVTGEVLKERGAAGSRALVIGGDGVREALESAGIVVAEDGVDFVVVGWDPDFTYDAMRRATMAILGGAQLIATNDDAAFPAPDGLWPGAGAILASIETASGATAEVMGKPHEPMMEAVARRIGAARNIALIGDRPETDLAGGRARGWTTILVTSGVTSPEDAQRVSPDPDLVVGSLADLTSRQ